MANFERLIKGALSSQDDTSAEVRQVVYQSSRNALQKIIDGNRSLTVEAVMQKKRELEDCITRIEAEYLAPPIVPEPTPVVPEPTPIPEPAPMPEPVPVPKPVPAQVAEPIPAPAPEPEPVPVSAKTRNPIPEPVPETDPLHEIQQILQGDNPAPLQPQPVASEPVVTEPVVHNEPIAAEVVSPAAPDESQQQPPVIESQPPQAIDPVQEHEVYYEEEAAMPLGFSKRRKTQKRFLWSLITLVILGLLAWIAYIVVNGVLDGSLIGREETKGPKLNPNSVSRQADSDNYITIMEATEASTLITADRGTAQLVKELNIDMIRLVSTRDEFNRAQPAKPMLIRLQPGVLKQISGKRVTVEIFAKSGSSDTAHFAVGCEFGGLTECGRKRFLAGSQPNASVFAFQMDTVSDINQDMFLTLSTDTTSEAAVTGRGDTLDIVYVRLSVES